MTTRRLFAGEYEVSNGTRAVRITLMQFSDGPGWIAAARWNCDIVSDPLPTKREAVAEAHAMLDA